MLNQCNQKPVLQLNDAWHDVKCLIEKRLGDRVTIEKLKLTAQRIEENAKKAKLEKQAQPKQPIETSATKDTHSEIDSTTSSITFQQMETESAVTLASQAEEQPLPENVGPYVGNEIEFAGPYQPGAIGEGLSLSATNSDETVIFRSNELDLLPTWIKQPKSMIVDLRPQSAQCYKEACEL